MRVSRKDLDLLVEQINKFKCVPNTVWENGKANIGVYHIYSANGGYNLHVICNNGGGIHSLMWGQTKAELYYQIKAFLLGLHSAMADEK